MSELEFYIFKLMIMLPSIFLLFVVFPSIYSYLDFYIVVPLLLLPLLRKVLNRDLAVQVYPVFSVILLLITIYSFVYYLGLYQNYVLNHLLIAFTYKTLISFMTAIGIVMLEEGIFTKRMQRVVGSVIVSNLFFLEQFAAIYLMKNPGAIPGSSFSNLSFYQAFSMIAYLELLSIYSFIMNGYEYLLPLATFKLPYSEVILTLFLVSIVALILFFYRSDRRWLTERGVALGYSVITGSILGALAILLLNRLNTYYYGGMFLLLFVFSIVIYSIYTSRRSYYTRIEK